MSKNLKFGLLTAIILGTLGWLAAGGISQTATYYKEIAELQAMGPDGVEKRLRVGGDVEANSIVREGNKVHFTIIQNDLKLKVIYAGIDPLPDTFKDGSEVVLKGRLTPDGFQVEPNGVMAKCPSRYEAAPAIPH